MKRKKLLVMIAVAIFLLQLFWLVSYLRVEIATKKYENQFANLYLQTNMLDTASKYKLLRLREGQAKVYYSNKNEAGITCYFVKSDGMWKLEHWECVWSVQGAADGFVWPFFR